MIGHNSGSGNFRVESWSGSGVRITWIGEQQVRTRKEFIWIRETMLVRVKKMVPHRGKRKKTQDSDVEEVDMVYEPTEDHSVDCEAYTEAKVETEYLTIA